MDEKLIDAFPTVDHLYVMLGHYTGLKISRQRFSFPIKLLNSLDGSLFEEADAKTVFESLSEDVKGILKYASSAASFESLFTAENFDKLIDQLNLIRKNNIAKNKKAFLHPNIIHLNSEKKIEKEDYKFLNYEIWIQITKYKFKYTNLLKKLF